LFPGFPHGSAEQPDWDKAVPNITHLQSHNYVPGKGRRLTVRLAILATIRPDGNFIMAAHQPAPRTGRARYARLPLVAAPRLVPEAGYRATLRSILVGPSVTPRIMRSPNILVFDSGVGGLTVFREIARARPDARFVYAADDALFPYGKLGEAELVARVTSLMDGLIETHRPDLVVIACNTASVQVLPALRARFSLPFVGTVPAIKPACAASQSKRVSVLGTEATVAREYTHELIRSFGQGCDLTLVGSGRLAMLAEAALSGEVLDEDAVLAEIEPCFVDGARRTDTIVLACTHFPLLLDHFERLAPWPVRWLDPAPAIARRVVELLGPASGEKSDAEAFAVFTSGRKPSGHLGAALVRFGLSSAPGVSA
jgi:glutamate racemase